MDGIRRMQAESRAIELDELLPTIRCPVLVITRDGQVVLTPELRARYEREVQVHVGDDAPLYLDGPCRIDVEACAPVAPPPVHDVGAIRMDRGDADAVR
jgi:hypothetical protein